MFDSTTANYELGKNLHSKLLKKYPYSDYLSPVWEYSKFKINRQFV